MTILKLMKVWKLMILLSRKKFSSFLHIENGDEIKHQICCLVWNRFSKYIIKLQIVIELLIHQGHQNHHCVKSHRPPNRHRALMNKPQSPNKELFPGLSPQCSSRGEFTHLRYSLLCNSVQPFVLHSYFISIPSCYVRVLFFSLVWVVTVHRKK